MKHDSDKAEVKAYGLGKKAAAQFKKLDEKADKKILDKLKSKKGK